MRRVRSSSWGAGVEWTRGPRVSNGGLRLRAAGAAGAASARGVTVVALAALLVVLPSAPGMGAQLDWSSSDAGGAIASGGGYRLGATAGQGDANLSAAPGVVLVGGFWAIAGARAVATPTPTATATASASASRTGTVAATATATATRTGELPPTATATMTRTPAPDATPTATAWPTTITVSPTPTATPRPGCTGDCNDDGQVRVDELVALVNVALELQGLAVCPAGDGNGDGRVTIDEVLLAVNHALGGCPAGGVVP